MALLFADATMPALAPVRGALATIVSPLEHIAHAPYLLADSLSTAARSHDALLRRNAELEAENRVLAALGRRLDAALAENDRLRTLFDANPQARHNALSVEIIAVSRKPREVVIDKGSQRGIAVGDTVVDAAGLFGQVVETNALTSRVLLVHDPSHAVPVQVRRGLA